MSFAQKIVWISDTHITESGSVQGAACQDRLRQMVGEINRHHSDASACVASGDLTDTGTAGEYRMFRDLTADLAVPLVPMIGNHDDRGTFLSALDLPGVVMPGFAQFRLDLGGVTLLCLDTNLPGQDAGALDQSRLDWLAAQLDACGDRPTLVFAHHPPGPLGLGPLDTMPLFDHAPLTALLARARQPLHLCCGHVHRSLTGVFEGVGFTTLRSLVFQTPPPQVNWDWDSFYTPPERPQYAVILIDAGNIIIQMHDLEDLA